MGQGAKRDGALQAWTVPTVGAGRGRHHQGCGKQEDQRPCLYRGTISGSECVTIEEERQQRAHGEVQVCAISGDYVLSQE